MSQFATPTIHNAAAKGQIAKTVLMPGDPLRAKFIAESYLKDARLLSDIRGILCYTGTYEDTQVSVMGSGMGAGSMGIYSYELFNHYDVDNILRVGSAGGLHSSLRLEDIVLGMASCTDTGYATQYGMCGHIAPCANYELISAAMAYAAAQGISAKVGPVFSGEAFYYDDSVLEDWGRMGALAVEMESAALYLNAMQAGKRALAICTISDLIMTGEKCTTERRQTGFDTMIKMALAVAQKMK